MPSQSTNSSSLPGAPVAGKVGPFAGFAAGVRGRFEPPGAPEVNAGHCAYTLGLQGDTERAESLITEALISAVSSVDRIRAVAEQELAERFAAIERCGKELTDLTDPEPDTLAAARTDRKQARLVAEKAAHLRGCAELRGRIAGLLSTRIHTIEQAQALVAGHGARFATLAAAHRRGHERRRASPGAVLAATPSPTYTPRAAWVTEGMPILVTTIGADEQRLVHWALHEFEPPSSPPASPLRAV